MLDYIEIHEELNIVNLTYFKNNLEMLLIKYVHSQIDKYGLMQRKIYVWESTKK